MGWAQEKEKKGKERGLNSRQTVWFCGVQKSSTEKKHKKKRGLKAGEPVQLEHRTNSNVMLKNSLFLMGWRGVNGEGSCEIILEDCSF